MIIMFEGPDAAGKDTLRREFEKGNNYKHTCITRAFLSQMVYAQYYRRELCTDIDQWLKYGAMVRKFFKDFKAVLVIVDADSSLLKSRILARGENPLDGPDSDKQSRMFHGLMWSLKLESQSILIDTTWKTVPECVDKLTKEIELLEKETKHGRVKNGSKRAPANYGRTSKSNGNIARTANRK